jgi:hypothetical protein
MHMILLLRRRRRITVGNKIVVWLYCLIVDGQIYFLSKQRSSYGDQCPRHGGAHFIGIPLFIFYYAIDCAKDYAFLIYTNCEILTSPLNYKSGQSELVEGGFHLAQWVRQAQTDNTFLAKYFL